MKKEIAIFLTAIMFFTRIPCPKNIDHSPEILTKSSRYFSLVGIIVGGFGAFVFYLSEFLFNDSISILVSIATTIWITGAFHEDGFADVCDGFGGGWTKEKILTIMKDSRVGTYGIVGLGILLAIKHQSLIELDLHTCIIALISGHAISRFAATTLIYTEPYVQDIDKSKIKPSAVGITIKDVLICGVFALIPLLFFFNPFVFLTLVPVLITKYLLAKYFHKWIGGHTGDCAGATQQLTEVVFYLSLIIIV
ncbi:adenosylcobinamide-GDP ribazoletransferase [Wenyingzhuangia heitensis]|uniref:Adenosylcobinamide-GDP ribazoletransferase n=1 Tax=Wenyingzhuangia heitensis TaxID=1487859 RepID=A0ABX0UBS5_9FLAO|nr:adenosylcobinamide-GDP ribazoletransferase [Wenyingzhuangia heitensis]NIJ46267.1 adenosylcobinamide-GDP ribazoletransferase [Wenyingzhuangia heitensis]